MRRGTDTQIDAQTYKRTAVATVDDVVQFYISHIISLRHGNTIDIGLPIRQWVGFGQSRPNFDMGWFWVRRLVG